MVFGVGRGPVAEAAVVGDTASGAGIGGEGQKERAFGRFEIREVALPDEAGPIRCGRLGKPVFGDGVRGVRVLRGRKRRFCRGRDRLREPGEAVLAAAPAQILELTPHAQAAIGPPALREALRDGRQSRWD